MVYCLACQTGLYHSNNVHTNLFVSINVNRIPLINNNNKNTIQHRIKLAMMMMMMIVRRVLILNNGKKQNTGKIGVEGLSNKIGERIKWNECYFFIYHILSEIV